jgi:hypothetical protein
MEKPEFATKEAEIEWVVKNKDLLILEKKNERKFSDSFLTIPKTASKTTVIKAENDSNIENGKLSAELVINTTNLIDSHLDCHIDGCFNKSLKELGTLYLLQEHEMEFKYIIADSVNDGLKASVKNFTWKDLGLNFQGNTQALVFNTSISKIRNEFMYNQYKNGYVLNHSIGMRYVKVYLCVNSDNSEYTAEKDAWDKYYPIVANKEIADQRGYFWAVTELKIIEGSAVVKGSNYATPTISITENKQDIEPLEDTQKEEPTDVTQIKWEEVISKF